MAHTAELERSFLVAYDRLHDRAHDHAERFLAKDDGSDAVADAMAILWSRWATLTAEQRNDNYAIGIVRNCVHERLRKATRLVALDAAELEIEQQSVVADTEAHLARADADRDEQVAEIRDRVLATMPLRRREVLLLVLEHAMSYRVAGETLGLSKGTISQHMRLALATLRAAFIRAGVRLAATEPKRLPSYKGGAKDV